MKYGTSFTPHRIGFPCHTECDVNRLRFGHLLNSVVHAQNCSGTRYGRRLFSVGSVVLTLRHICVIAAQNRSSYVKTAITPTPCGIPRQVTPRTSLYRGLLNGGCTTALNVCDFAVYTNAISQRLVFSKDFTSSAENYLRFRGVFVHAEEHEN